MKRKAFDLALILIGAAAAVPGAIEIMLSLSGRTYSWGGVSFAGDFMLWRGLILSAAGVFYFLAKTEADPIQAKARAVLASLMIWIVGGVEALSLVLGSIPGGEGRWISTAEGFLQSYGGPFIPSLFLLPLSVGFLMIFLRREGEEG